MPSASQLLDEAIGRAQLDTIIELQEEAVKMSPAWTGWYRINHHVTEGAPAKDPVPAERPKQKGFFSAEPPRQGKGKLKWGISVKHYLSNPVWYADHIENGTNGFPEWPVYDALAQIQEKVFKKHLRKRMEKVRRAIPELNHVWDDVIHKARFEA